MRNSFGHIKRPASVFIAGALCAFILAPFISSVSSGGTWLFIASLLLLLFACSLFFARRRKAGAVASLVAAGALFAVAYSFFFNATVIEPISSLAGRECEVKAVVIKYPASEFSVEVKAEAEGKSFKAILKLYNPDYSFKPGDILTLRGRLATPSGKRQFDAEYYTSKGIYLFITPVDSPPVVSEAEPSLLNLPNRLLVGGHDLCDIIFGKSSGYMKALILGDKTGLDGEARALLADTGLSHAFVVSGMHLSFVVSIFFYLQLRKTTNLILIVLAFLFTAVTGFGIPIIRAFIMLALSLFARVLDREYDGKTAFFVAIFVVLLINPLSIGDLSFILSFSAVAGLLFISSGFSAEISLPIYLIESRKTKALLFRLASAFSSSFCAGLATIPAAAVYIGNVSVIFLLSNLFLLWIVFLLFVLGSISLFISAFSVGLGILAAKPVLLIFGIFKKLLTLLASLPVTAVAIDGTYIIAAFTILLFLVALLYSQRKLLLRPLPLCSAVLIICAALFFTRLSSLGKEYTLTILPESKGEAVLFESGNRFVVINCGEGCFDSVTSYMKKHNIKKIDALLLLGEDKRYSGDADRLIISRTVSEVIDNGEYLLYIDAIKLHYREGYSSSSVSILSENAQCGVIYTSGAVNPGERDIIIASIEACRSEYFHLFTGDTPLFVVGGALRDPSEYGEDIVFTVDSGNITITKKTDGYRISRRNT